MNRPASRDLSWHDKRGIREPRFLWLILLLAAAVAVFVRIRLLDTPFERDEGEYAYTARLILSGVPPYTEAYDLKMPGLHCAYALFLCLFGNSVAGVHLGLLLVNILSAAGMFFLGRELYGRSGGIISSASFMLMSLSQRVYGFSANAEPILLLPLLFGLTLLVRLRGQQRRSTLFFSGCLFGLAFIVKQTAVFFIILALVYIVCNGHGKGERPGVRAFKKVSLFFIGVLLPFTVTAITLFLTGAFGNFWFWTFEYAYLYSTVTPLALGFKSLYSALVWIVPPVTVFWGVAGFCLLARIAGKRDADHTLFEFLFFVFSAASVSAGFYFREHYFILLIPVISTLFGGGTVWLAAFLEERGGFGKFKNFPAVILCIAAVQMIYSEKEYLFIFAPEEVLRSTYNVNPFVESIWIAEYIKENTGTEDRVGILGSEPQIFFYSKRLSATKHIVMYPLMNPGALQMQVEFISEIERAEPEILLFVKSPGSWGLKEDSEKLVFNWAERYIAKHYIKSAVVEINPPAASRFYLDENVLSMKNDITYGVYIFKRKGSVAR